MFRSIATGLLALLCFWATTSFGAGGTGKNDAASQLDIHVTGDSTLGTEEVIRISGLTREPDLSTDEIRMRLLNTGLFSFVAVARSGNQVDIRLQQKVTWFVIPYVSSDKSGTYYSIAAGKAVFAHEDVFGFGRYQIGTADHEGTVGMLGRYLLGSPWDAGLTYGFEDAMHWIYTGREITAQTFNQYYGGNLELGYRLSLDWKLALANYVEHHRFELPIGGEAAGLQWSHKLSLEFNRFYTIDGLGLGHDVSVSFEATNPISDFHFFKFGLRSKHSLLRRGNFDWVVMPRVDYSPSLPYYQLFELGGSSLRGFPSEQFRGRYAFAVLNDLYLHTWNLWMLKPRLLLVADWAFLEGEGRTAVGGGFQFGIRDLLFSAIQVLGAYGFNPNGFAITLALGQHF